MIIRGGGATSDLNSFDSYLLAANCAQFPLPIITGIGHERDDTIVDMVAHTRLKTPTAVAEFLISRMDEAASAVDELRQAVIALSSDQLMRQRNYLRLLTARFPSLVMNRVERIRSDLRSLAARFPAQISSALSQREAGLGTIALRLRNATSRGLAERGRFLQLTEQFIKMASPEYILRRGYSLTMKEGKIVKHAAELREGDELTTRFMDGEVKSIVQVKKTN